MPNTLDEKKLKRITFDVKCAYDDLREAAKVLADKQPELLASAQARLQAAVLALKMGDA